MRKRIYEIIELADENDILSKIYDFFMMSVIIISIIPLAVKGSYHFLEITDKVTVFIFVIDYLLRLITADYKLKKGIGSFFLYPITPMALIDLFAILPSFLALNNGLRLLKVFRLLRTFRVFRIFKVIRYSKNIQRLFSVIKRSRNSLITVCVLAIGYIIVCALVIFNIEPDTFNNFFDAVYWATVSLTTVGYGDIYAISVAGKIITMLSALVGIAIVALPAGIITAGYMQELEEEKNSDGKNDGAGKC